MSPSMYVSKHVRTMVHLTFREPVFVTDCTVTKAVSVVIVKLHKLQVTNFNCALPSVTQIAFLFWRLLHSLDAIKLRMLGFSTAPIVKYLMADDEFQYCADS
jgi:hypothetical protein